MVGCRPADRHPTTRAEHCLARFLPYLKIHVLLQGERSASVRGKVQPLDEAEYAEEVVSRVPNVVDVRDELDVPIVQARKLQYLPRIPWRWHLARIPVRQTA